MTSLRVIDDAGTVHVLDLYEQITVRATYQFKDIRGLQFQKGNYTDTFRVPNTPNNIAFFGPLFDPTASTSYVTKRKKRAFIEEDSIPVFAGFLRLVKAIVQKGRYAEFEISLFGDIITFAKDLGEKKLTDLDFSGLDHVLNYANVTGSWALSLESGNVVYGFADYGARFGCLSTSFRDISDSANALSPDHFKPCVRIRHIVDQAFLAAGWTYESDFFDDTDFGKMYVPWVNHAGERMLFGTDSDLFWAGMPSDSTQNIPAGTWQGLGGTWDDSTAPYYDEGADFTVASQYWTAPSAGIYTFQYNLPISWTGSGTQPTVQVALRDPVTETVWDVQSVLLTTTAVTLNRTVTLSLATGDIVRLDVQGDPSIAGASNITAEGGTGGTGDITWLQLLAAPDGALGATLDMTTLAPEGKAIDYITDLAILFNLVFIPDENKEKHLKIEPFKDYLDAGDTVDWSRKLDVEKDYTIVPAAEFQKKKIVLSYLKDEDFYSQQVTGSERDDGQRVYGEKVIDNSDNDFSEGTELIQTKVFASTPLAGVDGSIMVCPKYWDAEGAPIKPKPRLLYYGGATTAGTGVVWWMENDSGTPTAQTTFAYMGQFETFNSGLDDYDMAFGVEQPFHYVAFQTYNNLFYQYWQQYLIETYSEDGRVLTAFFKLTVNDIINSKYNDRVYVLGEEWRINKINSYGIGNDETTEVELIKIISERRCAWLPDSVDVFGEVTMVDSEGNTGAGTQACCELFGYRWDGSACFNTRKLDLGNTPTAGIGATSGTSVEEPVIPPPELRTAGTGGVRRSWGVGLLPRFGDGDNSSEGFSGLLSAGNLPWLRHDGEFAIGGGWQRSVDGDPSAEIQARGQAGTLVLIGEGDISTVGNLVELQVQGRDSGEFNPPEDCVSACRVHCVMFTDNSGIDEVCETTWTFLVKNDGGTVTTSSSPVAGDSSGGFLANLDLSLSVSGSLVTLALEVGNNGTSANTLYATARLDYVWARLR